MSLQRRPLAVWAFQQMTRILGAIMALPNHMIPPPFRLMQIGSAFWQSRALYTAAKLDLATILADRRLAVDDLARETRADPDTLRRLMRMLAAMGIFQEVLPGVYRNNRLSDPLRADRKGSVRAIVMMHNSPEMTRPWFEALEGGIRTGEVPFELTHRQEFYAYLDAHPQFDALFAESMDCVEALAGDGFATDFDWARFSRIIDVGGSNGTKSAAILRRHPHLHAVVVDRAQTIANARKYWEGREDFGALARMRFEVGDVFSAIPAAAAGDIYLLSAVLHGFDDASCVRALTMAAAAAGAVAPIVVLEFVMPATGADITAASMDMQMFMATRGRERSHAEWLRIFAKAGVELSETVGLASFGRMMVLRTAPDA